MSFEAALIVAFTVIVGSLVVVLSMLESRRHAAQEQELQQAASSRGWTFESLKQSGYRVHRFSGTTDGVPWTAESLRRLSGEHKSRRRQHIARWHGEWSPGINSPILAMGLPQGKESLGDAVLEGDGVLAKMAQKAAGFAFDKAVDVYFGDGPGKEVDAGAMRRADSHKIPGFIVMAIDKSEAARILSDGFERALIDQANQPQSILSGNDRPWILLRPKAISLARQQTFRDVNELEQFVRAGVSLTRAFRFGHR